VRWTLDTQAPHFDMFQQIDSLDPLTCPCKLRRILLYNSIAAWVSGRGLVRQHSEHGRRWTISDDTARSGGDGWTTGDAGLDFAGLFCVCVMDLSGRNLAPRCRTRAARITTLLQAFGPEAMGTPDQLSLPLAIAADRSHFDCIGGGWVWEYAGFLAPRLGHWQLVLLAMAYVCSTQPFSIETFAPSAAFRL
jgi:hypothetical protein